MTIARVALPLPVADAYRYRIPESLADRALPGARVVVPVRQGEMVGIVISVADEPGPDGVRDLLATPLEPPALTPPLLELALRAARHWGAPPGLMLRAMLPAALWGKSSVRLHLLGDRFDAIGGTAGQLVDWLSRRGGTGTASAAARALRRPVWDLAERLQRIGLLEMDTVPAEARSTAATERVVTLAGDPLTLVERDRHFARSPAQGRLYLALEAAGGTLPVAALLQRAAASDSALKGMVKSGLARVDAVERIRDPFADVPTAAPPESLTRDQRAALQAIAALPAGASALLFGVTGSGKTAVYLERIRQLLDAGRGAILMVPEIALTPQTVARVRGAFGDQVAVLHSALSDGERADAWRLLRRGERRVAVGARSAVFAPIQDLGVIVLDEEHESSYKNGETPRYHARDIAMMRANLEGATVILGSATPSLESWHRADDGAAAIRLPERIGGRQLPEVQLVDLGRDRIHLPGDVPWSQSLDTALTETLARGEQALLLLNRRGWASFIQCAECGAAVECPDCSIAMTLHQSPVRLRCHYCNHSSDPPEVCAICGGSTVKHRGAGTQQLERLLAERFPAARLARMDLDTTSSRWSHHRILDRVARGEVDILLGTQMIAKGIDIPTVTLVGVVDADLALHLPDFRAAERTFQLVAQVSGRAGRGERGGRVIVQTRQVDHPALQFAARHDAEGFLHAERENRKSPSYPPLTGLARLVLSGPDSADVESRAVAVAQWSERAIARGAHQLIVLGPAPCPVERVRGEWRWHILVKGDPTALGRWVRTIGPRLGGRRGGVRMSLDREPVNLL